MVVWNFLQSLVSICQSVLVSKPYFIKEKRNKKIRRLYGKLRIFEHIFLGFFNYFKIRNHYPNFSRLDLETSGICQKITFFYLIVENLNSRFNKTRVIFVICRQKMLCFSLYLFFTKSTKIYWRSSWDLSFKFTNFSWILKTTYIVKGTT